jgi:hypothetical protein
MGRAIAQAVVAEFPPTQAVFELGTGHLGFVVDRVVLGHVLSEYFGFLCQFSFHRLLHVHHDLSSGAGTIGQFGLTKVVDCLNPPQETKKKEKKLDADVH